MDIKTLQLLEFDKVLAKLAEYTSFSGGTKLALNLFPTTDLSTAQRWQAETAEALKILDSQREISIGGTRDVRQKADNAERGFTLLAEDFLEIRNTLLAAKKLRDQLIKSRHHNPRLADIADLIEDCPKLVTAIDDTLDERGEVLDSASIRLANIRKELRVVHGRIQDKLQRLLNSELNKHLQEPLISMRGGRYVVPVRADAKTRIKGIIHDQSGSGATVWVEPMNTVDLNNEFRGLHGAETAEINRILAALSGKVAEDGEPLKRIVERMAELDLILARARYASSMNAVPPEFVAWRTFPIPKPPKHANERDKWTPPPRNPHPGSTIWVQKARHPLLSPDDVVPTDWTLDEDTFVVLITGPNTGGKTVSLKTMGLMVLMAQSGLHLPALSARLTLFNQVFADIGDEQSLEQNLSTFSGHITNIIRVMERVDDRSLVLFDELGSGTDPSEGAALAQALISYLLDKGATTLVATHYPELKLYASQTRGATNASLLFDVDTLSPTYELSIGLPGKSNALVIARRLGLDETILDEALRLVGSGSSEAEELLDSIHDIRERISTQEAASRIALRQAEADRTQLEKRLTEIEAERDELLRQAQKTADRELGELRDEIRQVRKGLRDAQSITAVKKLSQHAQQLEEEGLGLPDDLKEILPKKPRRNYYEKGDVVQILSLKTRGEVVSVGKAEAMVAVGRLQIRVRFDDLELRDRPKPEPETAVVVSGRSGGATSPGMELDIRGERVESGLNLLDRYLDSAFLANLPYVRIVHGKGTGKLRQAVRKALDKNRHITNWEEGQDGEGGAGVTVARFKGD